MPLTQLAPPYPIFTDRDGSPLDNGYLYFGTAGLNPETNPIQVYYDINLTQPAAQPLRTSNGYVMRSGSPALIYANEQFSVTVRDKNSQLVIYSPVGFGIAPGSAAPSGSSLGYDDFIGTGSTTVYSISSTVLSSAAVDVFIDGIYQSKDNYTASGSTVTFSTAPPFLSHIEIVSYGVNNVGSINAQNTIFNAAIGSSINRTAQQKMAEIPSVKDFGATGDGVTNDAPAFAAAWAATSPQAVYVPAGSYAITGSVTGKFFSFGAVTVVGGTVTTITNLVP